MDSSNPSNKSTAEKLLAQRENNAAQNEIVKENMVIYAKALNAVAATPNGEAVLKTMVKALEVFTAKSGRDGVALIEVNTKRNFYFEFIRPYLEPQLRQKIEG